MSDELRPVPGFAMPPASVREAIEAHRAASTPPVSADEGPENGAGLIDALRAASANSDEDGPVTVELFPSEASALLSRLRASSSALGGTPDAVTRLRKVIARRMTRSRANGYEPTTVSVGLADLETVLALAAYAPERPQ